jgi:hypothetical protein
VTTLDVAGEPEARRGLCNANWQRRPERNRIMKRICLLSALVLLLIAGLAGPAASAAAPPSSSTWHRLNPDQSNPAPEHERLRCVEAAVWVCRYDKVPEPELNFSWNSNTAQFIGRDITASWTCPEWFTECAAVTSVVEGTATYRVEGANPFKVLVDLIFIDDEVLYLSWVDFGFACPWYPTFDAALEANPFPLPFNGVEWPEQDCIVASAQ